MILKGAIFDLDGTLLDSMPLWDGIGAAYLKTKGLVPGPGLTEALAPLSLPQAAEYLRAGYGLRESQDEIVRQINALIADSYRYTLLPKPSAEPFLRRLKRQNVRMCVATATDRPLAEAALERLKLRDYFCGVVTCSEAGAGKDRPDVYRRALSLLGTEPARTVVFEDALHAVETAKAAGFPVAAVFDESAAGNREKIAALADWYLNSLTDWKD